MDKNIIIRSIVEFLRAEIRNTSEEDSAESLEVATQCIESAFHVEGSDHGRYPSIPNLQEVFRIYYSNTHPEEAEDFKNRGNALMLGNRPAEALNMYNRAIELDSQNAIYYCNRAAAYSRIGMDEKAVVDCEKAIALDPEYTKAYSRLGLALLSLNRYFEARNSFNRAVELDPNNMTYRNNVKYCEERLAGVQEGSRLEASTSGTPLQSVPQVSSDTPLLAQSFSDLMNQINFQQLINNPNILNLATQVLENPQVQTTMQGAPDGGFPNIASLVNAGHLVVQEMESNNPELLQNLRRMLRGGSDGENTPRPVSDPSPGNTEDDDDDDDLTHLI